MTTRIRAHKARSNDVEATNVDGRTCPAMFGSARALTHDFSRHLHRDRAKEVALANIDAAVTQDRVGGGKMEIEVRQHEMVEVVGALHVPFVGRAERKRNVMVSSPVDLLQID